MSAYYSVDAFDIIPIALRNHGKVLIKLTKTFVETIMISEVSGIRT
jgi:hypothetical protein